MKYIQRLLFVLATGLLTAPAFSGEAITYYHNDLLGSPVVATAPSGQVRWESGYEPHGTRRQDTVDQLASADNARWYTDHVHDEETSLSYMQARFYDPEFGRFMSMDPLGFQDSNPASFNRYAYANNNPYTFVDPDGRNALTKFLKQTIKRRGNVIQAAIDVADSAYTLVDPDSTVLERVIAATELFSPISVSDVKDASRIISRARRSRIPNSGVATVGGRKPINSQYAGQTHPSGVKFNERGFPDFSPHARAQVELDGLTGNYAKDALAANKAVGLDRTPSGYVWHHVEDGRTMQLIPQDIHNAARHTGGAAVIRHGGGQ